MWRTGCGGRGWGATRRVAGRQGGGPGPTLHGPAATLLEVPRSPRGAAGEAHRPQRSPPPPDTPAPRPQDLAPLAETIYLPKTMLEGQTILPRLHDLHGGLGLSFFIFFSPSLFERGMVFCGASGRGLTICVAVARDGTRARTETLPWRGVCSRPRPRSPKRSSLGDSGREECRRPEPVAGRPGQSGIRAPPPSWGPLWTLGLFPF